MFLSWSCPWTSSYTPVEHFHRLHKLCKARDSRTARKGVGAQVGTGYTTMTPSDVTSLPGSGVEKCNDVAPLGGPMVVGLCARPYFTSKPQMLPMVLSLRKYCETNCAQTLPAANKSYTS